MSTLTPSQFTTPNRRHTLDNDPIYPAVNLEEIEEKAEIRGREAYDLPSPHQPSAPCQPLGVGPSSPCFQDIDKHTMRWGHTTLAAL